MRGAISDRHRPCQQPIAGLVVYNEDRSEIGPFGYGRVTVSFSCIFICANFKLHIVLFARKQFCANLVCAAPSDPGEHSHSSSSSSSSTAVAVRELEPELPERRLPILAGSSPIAKT
jgi:hypothetical protein